MSDALLSPTVAAVTGAIAITLITVAIKKCDDESRRLTPSRRRALLPIMGVMGAFIFAAQMINFSIPGTGSSGHIVGGILIAAILGPWAAFLTLTSVIIIQCLLFADGGFLALGCNIINMAALTTLVAYPMFFRFVMRPHASPLRLSSAAILASIMGLFFGAVAVTIETSLSGVTALPMRQFLVYMVAIHLAIGLSEGIATAAVLNIVRHYRPDMIDGFNTSTDKVYRHNTGRAIAIFAVAALLIGGSFSWVASSKPDGLEWSILQVAGNEELVSPDTKYHIAAAEMQQQTALMPDYNTSLSGILGSGAIILAVLALAYLFRPRTRE